MNRPFLIVLALCVLTRASPLPAPSPDQRSFPVSHQQFLVLHPQVIAPQLSALKYEQPIIAPITQLGHISTPKEQLYFFYPSSPLSQAAPVVSFQRDDGQDFNLISFITNWFASKPAETAVPVALPEAPAQAAAPEAAPVIESPTQEVSVGEELRPGLFPDNSGLASKPATLELSDPDAELLPQNPRPPPQQPQQPRPPQPAFAPFPLVPTLPDRRVYIVSGQPQFFGNFDAFANPLNPIFSLQPLSAIIPRSKEDTQIEAVAEEGAGKDATKGSANDEAFVPPVADLKSSPEVVVAEVEPSAAQEVDAPVDVIARSNSRAEPITTEVEAENQQQQVEGAEQEVKRVENELVQEKAAGGKNKNRARRREARISTIVLCFSL